MRIGIATGTRADWGLLQPLASTLREAGGDIRVLATHQHLMPEMGDTLQEIRRDGFEPSVCIPAAGTPAEIMAQAASGFARELPGQRLDALVILGDRCEMLGVASAAMLSGIPIVHIAGGTVSEGALDDAVRHAITKMATLHFPETAGCASRILQMGEPADNVVTTGAIGVHNCLKVKRMSAEELTRSLDGWNPGENFLVVTLHAATLAEGEPLAVQEMLLDALRDMPGQWRFLITYPNSDVDPRPLIDSLHAFERSMDGRVKVVPSLGRVRYLSAVALSKGVVGNSSSALVEVPSLGVPSLDIGMRQQGREHGPSVIHADADPRSIATGLRLLTNGLMSEIAARKENPYAGENPVGLMTDTILNFSFHPFPVKKFNKFQP